MKQQFLFPLFFFFLMFSRASAQTDNNGNNHLYIDVHRIPAGTVKYSDVAAAHLKDLATESKYGVHFLKYWFDESKGVIYCLSSAPDTNAIRNTHRDAHGLLPDYTYEVTDGKEATADKNKTYFLDVHELGAGNVKAADVEKAHQKDLAVQKKYGVNFINYWVDEKTGTILCLSQASDASKVVATHKEAHGLVPVSITEVKQGQ